MAGFADRLSSLKAKQETKSAEKMAAELAEKAERATEARKGELQERRAQIAQEFEAASKDAEEGEKAIAEAEAFVAEQGEALDPEIKTEMEALKAEAGVAMEKFQELQSRLQAIDTEMSALEAPAETLADVEALPAIEAPVAEAPVEAPVKEEGKRVEKEDTQELRELSELSKQFAETKAKMEESLDATVTDFSQERLQGIQKILATVSEQRTEALRIGNLALEKSIREDPARAEVIADQLHRFQRQMFDAIQGARETIRLHFIHLKSEPRDGLKTDVGEIGKTGMVGGAEIRDIYRFGKLVTEVGKQTWNKGVNVDEGAVGRFIKSFNTPYHGGYNLWEEMDDSGLEALQEIQVEIAKNPELKSQAEKLAQEVERDRKVNQRRDMQIAERGDWK